MKDPKQQIVNELERLRRLVAMLLTTGTRKPDVLACAARLVRRIEKLETMRDA